MQDPGGQALVHQLRGTLARMAIALDAISEAIVLMDQGGAIQWCNKAFDQLVGKPHLQVLGQQIGDVLPVRRKNESGSHWDCEFRTPHRTRVLEIEITDIQPAERPSSVWVIHDVTERKRMEEVSRKEELLRKEKVALTRANQLMMGREERMLELKQEVNDLLATIGRPRKYTA